jgi:hypothetical protein
VTETTVVQVVTQDLERELEVLARYPADAPEATTLWEELRRAMYATWAQLPYLVLAIDTDGICWEGQSVVKRQEARGLVGALVNASTQSLTIVLGAELEEIPVFLTDGTWLNPSPLADLNDRCDDGEFARSIIKVTKAEKYEIKVSDYLG